MTLEFVNQKQIKDHTYTAYRDSEQPALTYIDRDGVLVAASLRAVWGDPIKLDALFEGGE